MFIPGKVVKTFVTKKGKEVIIRYPKWEDLDQLTFYINKLSVEDTFILFSGEKITKEEEGKTLANWFLAMEKGDKVVLGCFYQEKLVGIANVDRNLDKRKRGRHIGGLGISVAEEFRGEGIGFVLAKTIIEEAKKKIAGLKMIILDVFEINKVAQNLYKKLGFIEYGRLKGGILYKGNFIDEQKMVFYL
ncbi:MAG: GNAT family N-acetyltransferase [Microgenomates group bacterium]